MGDKVYVKHPKTAPNLAGLKLQQYEDHRVEGGEQEVELTVMPYSGEPECFELRTDAGYQILNKGEMRTLGEALIAMSEDD